MGKMHDKLKLKSEFDLVAFEALHKESQFDEVTEDEFANLIKRFTPNHRANGTVNVKLSFISSTSLGQPGVPDKAEVTVTLVPHKGVYPLTVIIAEALDVQGEYKFFLKHGVEKLWKTKK